MNFEEFLSEVLRQWNDFIGDRSDCTYEDYNNFIVEIFEQKREEIKF